MVNALLLMDVLPENDESWHSFEGLHNIMHQTAYDRMLDRNLVPTNFPVGSFPREGNEGYLLDHWEIHRSIARLLNLPDIPDLSIVDLTDQGEARDWLELHALVHRNENLALGIT